MSLKQLLRLPGTSCPDEALTDDPVLDGYIRELDAGLLGSARVRLLTLAEIKDHLLEAKTAQVEAGFDERAAAGEAVAAMGPAAEQARGQRRRLAVRFWKTGGIMAVIVAAAAGFFQFMPVFDWKPLRVLFLAFGVGLSGGLLARAAATYRWPTRWINTKLISPVPCSTCFEVALSRPLAVRMTAWIILAGVGIWSGVIIMALSNLRRPQEAARTISPYSYLVLPLAVLGTCWALYDLGVTPRRFHVRPVGFRAESWLGIETDVLWQDIVGVGTYYRWRVRCFSKGSNHFLLYRTSTGRTRRIWLRADMVNFDRFLHLIEKHVGPDRGRDLTTPGVHARNC